MRIFKWIIPVIIIFSTYILVYVLNYKYIGIEGYDAFRYLHQANLLQIENDYQCLFLCELNDRFVYFLKIFQIGDTKLNIYSFIMPLLTWILLNYLLNDPKYSILLLFSLPVTPLLFETGRDGIFFVGLLSLMTLFIKKNKIEIIISLVVISIAGIYFKGFTSIFGIFFLFCLIKHIPPFFIFYLGCLLVLLLDLIIDYPSEDFLRTSLGFQSLLPTEYFITYEFNHLIYFKALARMLVYLSSIFIMPFIAIAKVATGNYAQILVLVCSLLSIKMILSKALNISANSIISLSWLLACAYFFPHLRYFVFYISLLMVFCVIKAARCLDKHN